MNYLDEQGLNTYDTQIKSYVRGVMSERSEIPSSLMAVINGIDSKVDIVDGNIDTILSNYVTKTDLQSALSNIGGGEVITIHTTNASGNAHVECKSGDTVIDANLGDGDTVTVPFGVEYSIIGYDDNELVTKKITAVAAKMSSNYSFDLAVTGIDLGLPSGNVWAIKNIGATNPYEAGLYFSWANVNGYAAGSGHNFGAMLYEAPGCNLQASFTSGDPTYDAARANIGEDWRMPTYTECLELINNCTWTWKESGNTDYNGVAGYEVVGTNGNKIFLPITGRYDGTNRGSSASYGYYWSTTYYDSSNANGLSFGDTSHSVGNGNRYMGRPIRAIRDPQA